jgi:hypothetical protein
MSVPDLGDRLEGRVFEIDIESQELFFLLTIHLARETISSFSFGWLGRQFVSIWDMKREFARIEDGVNSTRKGVVSVCA